MEKGLLRLALYSLIESIRNEPVKYGSLICYYNNNNNNNNLSSSSTITTDYSSQYYGASYGQQHDYFMEAQIDMLVQEAEKLYNKLVQEITNGIIYDPSFSSSISSSPLLSSSSDGTTTKSSAAPPKSTARY
jgi:hypothetical protein